MSRRTAIQVGVIALALCGAQLGCHRPAATAAVHAASGMVFPPVVAGFQREPDIHRYDDTGRDVSAGYNLDTRVERRAAVTVYVYPAPVGPRDAVLAAEMTRVLAEIASAHPAMHDLQRGEAVHTQDNHPITGLRAWFLDTQDAPVVGSQRMVSDVQLFVVGAWFIEYRITTLERYAPAVAGNISGFLGAFRWPPALEAGR